MEHDELRVLEIAVLLDALYHVHLVSDICHLQRVWRGRQRESAREKSMFLNVTKLGPQSTTFAFCVLMLSFCVLMLGGRHYSSPRLLVSALSSTTPTRILLLQLYKCTSTH
jgi:hypothetical protein